MSIIVERPGLLTTLQDLGRNGSQHLGVPVNGAMDEVSHRLANLLVGNDENEATLEMTLNGPTLRFEEDAVIALCGPDMGGKAGNQIVPWWRPVRVPAGTTIAFSRPEIGCRAYLAVAGGFDVPLVLGSRSTALVGIRFHLLHRLEQRGSAGDLGDQRERNMGHAVVQEILEAIAGRGLVVGDHHPQGARSGGHAGFPPMADSVR